MGGYNSERNLVSFSSRKNLKDFILNGEDNSTKIKQFYKQGFVPMQLIDDVDKETYDKFTKVVYKYNEANVSSKTEKKDDELIPNNNFAEVLNYKGELQVNDSIYKYTQKGLYIVNENDYDYLEKYLDRSINTLDDTNGMVIIDNKIKHYVPVREQFDNTFRVPPPDEDGVGDGPSSFTYLVIPTNPTWYNSCVNTQSSWVNNIFGKSYACQYFFNQNYKLRTVFSVEDYYLFFDVYADAEFKQFTWIGWYACRDAKTVYLKINNADLTLADRDIKVNLTIGQNDIQGFWNTLTRLFESSDHKRAVYISTIWEKFNGSNSQIVYSPSYDELLVAANTATDSSSYISLPLSNNPQNNVQFDFSGFFGALTNKVIVVTVMGQEAAVTNTDILTLIKKAYIKYAQSRKDVGIVVVNKELGNDNSKILAYSTGNELLVSHNLAFASKDFNIPNCIKLNELNFSYSTTTGGNSTFGFHADLTVKHVDKYNVDIESGAFYDNRWGGSKFKIIKD
ncbi:hypothetical protein SL053_000194 [Flavobacterium psychrophilum]|nr:hypothetical protein [Flavobacterium psychrophilum]